MRQKRHARPGRRRQPAASEVSAAQVVIEAMMRAGAEFRFLPGGALYVAGLSRCSPDLRAAFLDGDGAELHQAAKALTASDIIPL